MPSQQMATSEEEKEKVLVWFRATTACMDFCLIFYQETTTAGVKKKATGDCD